MIITLEFQLGSQDRIWLHCQLTFQWNKLHYKRFSQKQITHTCKIMYIGVNVHITLTRKGERLIKVVSTLEPPIKDSIKDSVLRTRFLAPNYTSNPLKRGNLPIKDNRGQKLLVPKCPLLTCRGSTQGRRHNYQSGGGLGSNGARSTRNFLLYCIQNLKICIKISILLLNISVLVHFLAMQLS